MKCKLTVFLIFLVHCVNVHGSANGINIALNIPRNNDTFRGNNGASNTTEKIHTWTSTSPQPKNIDNLISLFTKTTTTTTTASTTTTTTAATASTTCQCGKGAKPRSSEEIPQNAHSNSNSAEGDVKIVQGEVSNNHAWPWMVAFVNQSSSTPRRANCGGSLISKDYILTAAHCIVGTKAAFLKDFKVYLGTNKINGNGSTPVILAISDVKIHPKFVISQGTPNFDVAVVRLATPVTFNSSISPVCLSQTGKPFIGKSVIAAGWGDLFSGQEKGSNVLREVGLNVIGNSPCNTTYGGAITEEMLCASGDPANKGTCQGDSGSGLYFKKPTANTYTLVGITSWGVGCGSPSVYTRASRVLNFIKGVTMNSTSYCSNTFFP